MSYFQGKVAVITGAASGIGRALALGLAREGCHLALSDINESGLQETLSMLNASKHKVTSSILDVANKEAVYQHADEVLAAHGHVDIVINNAGVALVDTVEHMQYDDFEWLMGINFWGVVYGTKAFLPHLKSRPSAHIVNISSIFGVIAVPSQSAYNASKFAVRGFTEALRMEMLDTNIAVTCVHPGGIKTNIVRSGRFRNPFANTNNHQATIEEFDNKMARTTADEAAAVIIHGMRNKKPKILIGLDAKFADWFQRRFPVAYQKIVARGAKKRGK